MEWPRRAFDRRAANYEKTPAGWHSHKMKEVSQKRFWSRPPGQNVVG